MAVPTPQELLAEVNCYNCYAGTPYMLQLLELGLLVQILEGGGGGGGGATSIFYTFGNWGAGDAIPEDGTIETQGAWNLDTGHAFVNIGWPVINPPVWAAH